MTLVLKSGGTVIDAALGPYQRLPDSLQIRHLRYWGDQPGFRTRAITLATTLVDANLYPADELANLYRRRWQAELHLRSLKTHMQMEHLRCKHLPDNDHAISSGQGSSLTIEA